MKLEKFEFLFIGYRLQGTRLVKDFAVFYLAVSRFIFATFSISFA
jgi:hypothetical protein